MEKKKLSLKEIGIEKIIIIFITGILLLVLSVPSFQKTNQDKEADVQNVSTQKNSGGSVSYTDSNADYTAWMEKRLTDILGQVEGIGTLKVMITLKGTSEKVTLKDSPYTQENSAESDGDGGTRENSSLTKEDESVLVTPESGESIPYVVKEIEPEIEGVVVLAQGAGSSKLIQEIVDAVQVLFDVPAHKIKVMKMEGAQH